MNTARFNLVARPYRFIERLAFGRLLQIARTAWLDSLAPPAEVLILGEGDGRFSQALRACFPAARLTLIDASETMIDLARRRIGEHQATFLCADARTVPLSPACYDLIVTHFFLDCFSQTDAELLIRALGQAATPGAMWLIADFELPPRGLARLHARLWLAAMYTFFRIVTGLEARRLPDHRPALKGQGFHERHSKTWLWGLLRSSCWMRRV